MQHKCVSRSPNKPQLQVGCNRMCQTSGCRAFYSGWQTSPTTASECSHCAWATETPEQNNEKKN